MGDFPLEDAAPELQFTNSTQTVSVPIQVAKVTFSREEVGFILRKAIREKYRLLGPDEIVAAEPADICALDFRVTRGG